MNKIRVLTVDDEVEFTGIVKSYLEPHGFDVRAAYNASEGLKMAEAEIPDILLLDITMPDADGFEVLERLKANSKTESIPVVIISVKDNMDHIVKALDMGAVDYIVKPVEFVSLLDRISRVLERKPIM